MFNLIPFSYKIVWSRHLVVVVGLLLRDRKVVLRQLEHFHVWVVPNLKEIGGVSHDAGRGIN